MKSSQKKFCVALFLLASLDSASSNAESTTQVELLKAGNNKNGNDNPKLSSKPDTPQMQKAWKLWHQQVAIELYQRSEQVRQKFLAGPQLACQIAYKVTADGQIESARILRKSKNKHFDSSVLEIVNSMKGSSILKFPSGSTNTIMEKTSLFTGGHIRRAIPCTLEVKPLPTVEHK